MSPFVSPVQPRPTGLSPGRPRDRRTRRTFWIDDRIVDDFVPIMRHYPFGSAALAIYAVLARRADRDGVSWPSLALIAEESSTSRSTVKRALRLLELLGLVDIAICLERGSRRQTSNRYTLLPPPVRLPQLDADPGSWPPPQRRTLLGRSDQQEQPATQALEREKDEVAPPSACPTKGDRDLQDDRGEGCQLNRGGSHAELGEGFSLNYQEENTIEGNTVKDNVPLFAIAEVGLSNLQVWAATLSDLIRQNSLSRAEIETWLRPAALVGREGDTLIVGAPNGVARDRIHRRFLPALREAIAATVGTPLDLTVVVAGASSDWAT